MRVEKLLTLSDDPCTVVMTLQVVKACALQVIGHSEDYLTAFFKRNITVDTAGTYTYRFPLPIIPSKLRIEIKSETEDAALPSSISFKNEALQVSALVLTDDDREYINFVKQFALEASNLPRDKVYSSDKKIFRIYYRNVLKDRKTGGTSGTPARIYHATKVIEISYPHFVRYTVPMRMMILLHEYMHVKLHTSVEEEADKAAIKIFAGLGFSKIEGMYAVTKIFGEGFQNTNRVREVFKELAHHDNILVIEQ